MPGHHPTTPTQPPHARRTAAAAAFAAFATAASLLAQAQPPAAPTPTPPTATPTTPTPPTLTLTAFTAYAHPDPEAIRRDTKTGTVTRCDGSLAFYVHLPTPGDLHLALQHTPTPPTDSTPPVDLVTTVFEQLTLFESPQALATTTTTRLPTPTTNTPTTTPLGTFPIPSPGYYRITLHHQDHSPLRNLHSLTLTGPAATNAHANTLERRNAASVHLAYPVPEPAKADVEWFYLELTPATDPLHTYYMATGWHRGYFGMQVNSKTERRLIFSVWDAGNEPTHRDRVQPENRVQLIAKGDHVTANDFGNEGTGGHSHLVHDWQVGQTYRFLLHAAPDATTHTTTYSGYFWFAERNAWGLIASFRAPKDGKAPHGLYSFSENFSGSTGDTLRWCSFGNAWVRTRAGAWLPLRRAHFTHDETGKAARLDRWAAVRGDRFQLGHGDFHSPPDDAVTTYRAELTLPATAAGSHPSAAELPEPPTQPK
jgi:hypothetical protein